jgi:hypothetical protein
MAKKNSAKAKKTVAKKSAAKKAPARRKASAPLMTAVSSAGPRELLSLIATLKDGEKPIQVRYAALQSLGAARFASPDFASIQGDYIAALRDVATDPDAELRQRALGILTREKDGFAQKKLLDGLKDPAEALVPAEKALQLLGNDIHAEGYAAARQVLKNPPNPTARREALRLLATDASSAPTFEKILMDKDETSEVRQLSAAALHSLKPEKLQQQARKILLDPSEYKEIQQVSLTALTNFGKSDLAKDSELMKRVNQMKSSAPAPVKKTARRFLARYGD